MANQYFNFYYDPVRQGYDTDTWTTVEGNPVVLNNTLVLKNAGIVHFADNFRGDAYFNINISAPAAGDDIKVGFIEFNKGAFAYFKVADDVLTAETSDGTNTESVVIAWQSSWTSQNTEFRVKWEAGMVTFFIGGIRQATIGGISVPNDPMSMYIFSDSTDQLLLNHMTVKSIQSSTLETGVIGAV